MNCHLNGHTGLKVTLKSHFIYLLTFLVPALQPITLCAIHIHRFTSVKQQFTTTTSLKRSVRV